MTLVQIAWLSGRINRLPRGQKPVVELDLEPTHEIVRFEIREVNPFDFERKTVDWDWNAWVLNRLEPPT